VCGTRLSTYSSLEKGAIRMTSIMIIPEVEATGKVKQVYDEIMEKLGIDFVPNMYKAMAHNPAYLETT
jgi:hypothetical protein